MFYPRLFILKWLLVIAVSFGMMSCGSHSGKSVDQEISALAAAYKPNFPPLLKFDPTQWKTNFSYPYIGDPKAKKGGEIRIAWRDFPPTLRGEGPNSNLSQLTQVQGLVYETLVQQHPNTLHFIPMLANYWQISKDKRTFRFHIDPKARWADGSKVTADDVLASWEHQVANDRKDPYNRILYNGSFEKPVIEDEYTISVHTKKLNWRLFLYFGASLKIYPAKYLRIPANKFKHYYPNMSRKEVECPRLIPGKKYLKWYQWRMFMGTGPYCLSKKELRKESSLVMRRRKNYWAKNEKWAIGRFNFDKIKWYVVREYGIQFEKFKKGDLDYYPVLMSLRWVKECNFDKVKKGWIQKRKIYNEEPQGFSGFAFNMRRKPFNDRRVRLAFAYLFNRKKLIDKLFYNQYDYIDSYFPGRDWGNPNNPKIRYNPDKAAQLLAEAGWKTRNSHGWLVDKNGKPLEILFEYGHKSLERIFRVVQEDYHKAGVKLDIKLLDYRTLLKKVEERKFLLHYQSWTALLFPNPSSSWSGKLAEKKHTNNLTGFSNKQVDRLCDEYNVTFDRNKQRKIIRKIDGLIFQEHPYALGWYANFTRLMFWNKFGYPKGYLTRTNDERCIISLWWYDPQKAEALKKAQINGTSLPVGEVKSQYWIRKK